MDKILEAALDELRDKTRYEHEAALFSRKVVGGKRVAAAFRMFAEEEAAHYEALKHFWPALLESVEAPGPMDTSDSLRETLKRHIESEHGSIRIYEEILRGLELPAHKLVIKGILAEEKEHLKAAIQYLKHLE